MLKAKKITEEQTAGRSLAPYFGGVGFQLRLAEAIRKLRQLSRPGVKRNKRIKAKGKVHTTNRLIMLTIKVKSELNILASERKTTFTVLGLTRVLKIATRACIS